MMIRAATDQDLLPMERLAEERRQHYQRYQLQLWRPATDGSTHHLQYLRQLIGSASHLVLVAEDDGALQGFLVAALVVSPPVYDPGGVDVRH